MTAVALVSRIRAEVPQDHSIPARYPLSGCCACRRWGGREAVPGLETRFAIQASVRQYGLTARLPLTRVKPVVRSVLVAPIGGITVAPLQAEPL